MILVDHKLMNSQNGRKSASIGKNMKSQKQYVEQMDQLLSELVQVATQLRDMSLKVISEEELAPLQKHQEKLLGELESVDEKIKGNYPPQIEASIKEKVHLQLQKFQQLNQEFIQNLNASKGLIQFDLHRLKADEEEDFSRLIHLNKMTPSPNRSKAIKAKESEEG